MTNFEEVEGVLIYPELMQRLPQIIFDLSLMAECASVGPASFEPFPTFLLKKQEMREREGYLRNVQIA